MHETSRWQQTLASMNKGGRQCSRADCDTVLVPGASKVRVARATVLRAGAAGLGALPGRDRLPTSAFDHCHGTMVKVASDVGDVCRRIDGDAERIVSDRKDSGDDALG